MVVLLTQADPFQYWSEEQLPVLAVFTHDVPFQYSPEEQEEPVVEGGGVVFEVQYPAPPLGGVYQYWPATHPPVPAVEVFEVQDPAPPLGGTYQY